MSPSVLEGGCLCGAVRYAIDTPLQGAGHCHCSLCRRAHGAAFATWSFVVPGSFRWTAGEGRIGRHASSPGQLRCFCRDCGSPLAAMHDGEVGEVVLASIDGDPGVRPDAHIFVGSKACWSVIGDGLPQHDEWPPGLQP